MLKAASAAGSHGAVLRALAGLRRVVDAMRPSHAVSPGAVSLGAVSLGAVSLGAVAMLAGLVPLLVTAPAPLMDWPSHLARVWITERVLSGDAFWMERYEFQGFLIPNAVLDLGILGLMRLGLGVGLAGSVFLVLLYSAFVGGVYRLAARIGSASAMTVPLAVTCFYSTLLFYGLVNFIAGLAAMAWALSAWCDLAERPGRRAALAVGATAGIALCHVVAAIIFLGVAACLDLRGVVRAGPFWLARGRSGGLGRVGPCVAGAVVLAVLLGLSPVETGGVAAVGYSGGGTLGGLAWRKGVILVRAMSSGQAGVDVAMALTAGLVAAAAYRVRAGIAWPWALAASGLLGLAFLAPDIMGEGAFLDARLVPASLLLLVVALKLRRAGTGAAALLVALVVVRMGLLTVEWHAAGRAFVALEAELARLPRGSILLAGSGTVDGQLTWRDEWSPPAGNIASLAVMHGIFVPSVFALPSQQPLALREEWRGWRRYHDVATPAQLLAVSAYPVDCRRHGPISILILHVRGSQADGALPLGVGGMRGLPFGLVRVC